MRVYQFPCTKAPVLKVVSFKEPDPETDPWRKIDPTTLKCLCACIDKLDSYWKAYIRHLEVDPRSLLWEHRRLEDSDDFHAEEFSLPDLLSGISRTETGKVVLGMQLAHALSCLYDGNWLTGRWGQENLSVFRRGNQVPCKPWLKVSLHSQSKPKSLKRPNQFPQINELGIILIELHIGETVESFHRRPPTDDLTMRWAMASKVFKIMENHILSDDYRRALAFCLNPTFGQLTPSEALNQPELVRQFIHENVVMRLERAMAKSRTNQDAFEALDLGETMRSPTTTPPSRPLPQERPRPALSKEIHHPVNVRQPDEDHIVAEIEEDFQLFGSECEPQPDQEQVLHFFLRSRVSDDWVEKFQKIVNARLKAKKEEQGPKDLLRVKVAVLDTGIDLKHIEIKREYKTGRIKSIRSWVDGADGAEDPDTGDDSGHGTFISSLLLDLGPRIDLYVARVSKSRDFKKGTSENIAKALYHARTEWKVDIINISFGYPCGVESIKSQITQAVQNDVLVFAAASNDGGNRSRMFPARQLGVFAIHSSTGHGRMSDFNPDPKRDENFGLLGEYVESAWLTKGGSASTRRLSGTSFATPIAVCLSAFILAYVPLILPEYEGFHHKLSSYEGMRNVLQLMANERTTGGRTYQYLSPQRYFEENTLSGIIESIKKALSM